MIESTAYTRVTLALDIVKKISVGSYAGYHELGIIKQQITLGDRITVEKSPSMRIVCNHPQVPTDAQNICWQAAELLKSEFAIKDNVTIVIDKEIPVQGGLAGGSTNAAEVLKMLNTLWQLDLKREDLVRLGRQLGMDVPFYFYGKTAYDTEATGKIIPLDNAMEPLHFLLVIPPLGVSTRDAYAKIDYSKIGKMQNATQNMISAIETGCVQEMVNNMHNDFEKSVFVEYEELRKIRDKILETGAKSAIMSGSGSTLIGVYDSKKMAEQAGEVFVETKVVQTLI